MDSIGVEEARRRLPELLNKAEAGEQTIIRRHNKAIAALVPIWQRPSRQKRNVLSLRGTGLQTWPATTKENALSGQESSSRPTGQGSSARPDTPEGQGSPQKPAKPEGPSSSTGSPNARFEPHRLTQGSVIALDAAALIGFLCDRAGCKRVLEPMLTGIAQGYWRGLLTSSSLGRVLAGPLSRGQEPLAQLYKQVLADPKGWTVACLDAPLVEAAVRLQIAESLPEAAALDLAAAIAGGASVLVSDDPHLARLAHPQLPVVPSGLRGPSGSHCP